MINKGFKIFLSILCLVAGFTVNAQYSTETNKLKAYESAGVYITSYFNDGMDIASGLFHWEKKDWIIAGSTIAAGSLIYIFDDDIRNFFQGNRSPFTNNLSKYFIEPFGSGVYSMPLFGLLYLSGEIQHNSKSKTVALNGLKTFVLSATLATVLKQLTKRHRPYQDIMAKPNLWEGPFGGMEYTSFPSGHTLVSFALASYVSSAYKDKPWVGIVSYSMAGLVGLSRLNDDKHWASDVFVGAVLGYAVGKCIHNNTLEKHNIQILPVSRTGLGLSLIKTL